MRRIASKDDIVYFFSWNEFSLLEMIKVFTHFIIIHSSLSENLHDSNMLHDELSTSNQSAW